MSKKPHFQVHSAVTIIAPSSGIVDLVDDPSWFGGKRPVEHKKGEDKEIIQLAVDVTKAPIKEHHFREAFQEMQEKCLERARQYGLVEPK